MTHIDIARDIRYRLLSELHRTAADLYAKRQYGSEAEIVSALLSALHPQG